MRSKKLVKLVKFVVKKVISGLLKIIVVYKEVEAYEEQGILEDGDSNRHFGADRTDDYAGSERLRYVEAYPQPLPERRGAWRGERKRSEPIRFAPLLVYRRMFPFYFLYFTPML